MNGDVDEVVGNGDRKENFLLAEEYTLGKLVPETRRQYELRIIKMTAWKKANRVALYDTISYPVVIITLLLVGYIMSDCERNSILARGRISKR